MPGTAERMPSYRPQGDASPEQPLSQRRAKRSYPPESHPAMKGSPLEYAITTWLGRRSATDNKETQDALQAVTGKVFDIVCKDLALSEAEATAVKNRVITGSGLRASTQIGETKNAMDAFEVLKESVESVTKRVIKEYRLERSKSGKR